MPEPYPSPCGQLLPGDPGMKHEQDARKGATVIDSFPTGMVEATLVHR